MRVNLGESPACEGFWTKLQHTFTRDSKSSAIVDLLIKSLITLKPEQRTEFDKLKIYFVCPKGDILLQATKFTEIVTKFMVDNFDAIKRAEIKSNDANKLYSDLVNRLNGIRKDLDKNMSNFVLITEEKDSAVKKGLCYKGRTYKDMGLSVSSVTTIAKDFRRGAASHLDKLKASKWESMVKGVLEANASGKKYNGDRAYREAARTEKIGNFSTFYSYASMAMKLYSTIDYFLFYTDKKVQKLRG